MYDIVFETYLDIERRNGDIVQEGKFGDFVEKARNNIKKVIAFIKQCIIELGRRLKFADRYYLSEQDYEILKALYKVEDDIFILSKNLENFDSFGESTEKIKTFYEKISNARGFFTDKISEIKTKYSSKVDKSKKFAIAKRDLSNLTEELRQLTLRLDAIATVNINFPIRQQEQVYGLAVKELAMLCHTFCKECMDIAQHSKTGSLFTSHNNDKNPNNTANEAYLNTMITSTSDYIAMENFIDLHVSFKRYKDELKSLNKKMKELVNHDDPSSIKEQINCVNESTKIFKEVRNEIANMPEDKLTVYMFNLLGGFLRFAFHMTTISAFLINFTNVPTNIIRLITILGIAVPPSVSAGKQIIKDIKNDSEPQSDTKKHMLEKIDSAIYVNKYVVQTLTSQLSVYQ